MSVTEQIASARCAAQEAGMRPLDVELGPAALKALDETGGGLLSASIFGMKVRRRTEEGVCVLALPFRHIGRYEIVIPTPFEAAA